MATSGEVPEFSEFSVGPQYSMNTRDIEEGKNPKNIMMIFSDLLTVYIGEWKYYVNDSNIIPHGVGTFIPAEGPILYGEWEIGKFVRSLGECKCIHVAKYLQSMADRKLAAAAAEAANLETEDDAEAEFEDDAEDDAEAESEAELEDDAEAEFEDDAEAESEDDAEAESEDDAEAVTISDWIRPDVNPETESKTGLITTWDGPFDEDGFPEGKGILRRNGYMVYAGKMVGGIPNDEKAWTLMYDISDKYPGWVGFVGTFVNGHPYGPCNIYPNAKDEKSIVRGTMIEGKFVEPAYTGSNMCFSEVVKLP
jgi:hypothetical protein